jgi:ATP-binding cassette subfamily G (WHITE) protein 2 (PDR)
VAALPSEPTYIITTYTITITTTPSAPTTMEEQNRAESRPGTSSSSSSSEIHESGRFQQIRTQDEQKPHHDGPGPNALRRHDSLAMMDENDQRELQRLATDISRMRSRTDAGSVQDVEGTHALWSTDPALDPGSPAFDMYKYLENIMSIFRKEGITTAQAGVAFKDLTVSGTGDAMQLQDTLADWLQMPLRIGEFFSFRKKEHRTILRSFDGIVNSGELLIVLGRPGSGCSTLLKSMTGQLHGLNMDENSLVNYNGIPQQQMMKEFKGEAIYNQEVCRASNLFI